MQIEVDEQESAHGHGLVVREVGAAEIAVEVMEAHVRHLDALAPTPERYFAAATVAAYLTKETPLRFGDAELHARWHRLRTSYLALTDRTAWCHAERDAFTAGDNRMTWLPNHGPPELNLRAEG
ncbi:hypothetical protein MUK60_02180 [Streptomyces sp. LRE541]|uniref:hypothetical protein n=1 Tax=Streptomyces sp. LRE541 TaxID=2931983 RepID=UPI00200D2AC0|nr:hypothetical protein [Streptomyces sp. LRE541]UPZ34559.1 hypothetical protein MUK60_02180 [Streptomyces sp. LRE541]